MKALIQKKSFTKKSYQFNAEEILITVKEIRTSNEIAVSFEELLRTKVTATKQNQVWLTISGVLLGVGIGSFFLPISAYALPVFAKIILLLLAVFCYHLSNKRREEYWKLKLTSGKYIYLHKKLPNEATVDTFIKHLYQERDQYLRKNYGQLNLNLTYDQQFRSFRFLKTLDVFSQEEYDETIQKLDALHNQKPPTPFIQSGDN